MMESVYNFFTNYEGMGLLFENLMKLILMVALLFVCAKGIHFAARRLLKMAHQKGMRSYENEKRISTVVTLLDTTLRIVLFVVGLLMLLGQVGIDITPLLTGAGIAGLAIGFGAQSLVKDVISGFFLLIEDQIRIGDVVKINGSITGTVERMELRITALRDKEGALQMIPNGEIKTVSNMTYEFGNAVIALPVPYATDLALLTKTLLQVVHDFEKDPAWKKQLLGKPEFLGVTSFMVDHMVVEVSVRTDPHAKGNVSRELHRRIKLALEQTGIPLLTQNSSLVRS